MSDERIEKEVKEFLRQAVAPMQDVELRRDLWPLMLRKLEEQPSLLSAIPWFDWVLVSIAGAALLFFPGIIPALFYHL